MAARAVPDVIRANNEEKLSWWGDFCNGLYLLGGLVECVFYLPAICFYTFLVGLLIGFYLQPARSFGDLDYHNTTVAITGASAGVGESMAYLFAAKGARLILTSRAEKRLKIVANQCRELGASQVLTIVADMANSTSVDDVAKFINEKFNRRLDYLMLCHFLHKRASYWHGTTTNMNEMRLFLEVNYLSYVQLASNLYPDLEAAGGRIVVKSNIMCKHAFPNFLIYSMTLAALDSFCTSWRQELSLRESKITITLAVLRSTIGIEQQFSTDHSGSVRPGEAENLDVGKCIIVGGFERQSEVYCPFWLKMPFSTLLNLPFVRYMIEKYIAYDARRRY